LGTDPRIRSGREPEVHPKVYKECLVHLATGPAGGGEPLKYNQLSHVDQACLR
jgi:hypothetical protein